MTGATLCSGPERDDGRRSANYTVLSRRCQSLCAWRVAGGLGMATNRDRFRRSTGDGRPRRWTLANAARRPSRRSKSDARRQVGERPGSAPCGHLPLKTERYKLTQGRPGNSKQVVHANNAKIATRSAPLSHLHGLLPSHLSDWCHWNPHSCMVASWTASLFPCLKHPFRHSPV